MTEQNQYEIDLLRNDPGQFVVHYQPLIDIIIHALSRSGYIRNGYGSEVKSYVNEKLLLKIDRIKASYNGNSLVRTYMSAVIRNMCLEKIREDRGGIVEEPMAVFETVGYVFANQVNLLVIKQELERLERIMMTFLHDRAKLEFCLKVLFRIPVGDKEIRSLAGPVSEEVFKSLRKLFCIEAILGEREIYAKLTRFFSFPGASEKSPDAIRKWIRSRLAQTITLMNGDPKRANYNEETIQLLFEHYFARDEASADVQLEENYRG